ncbi:MAG: NrdH-redoxin [Spirochaetaceae bacterium]|nr:MAG: NrdH-redoxin [Spirochaetaceae bacterium]
MAISLYTTPSCGYCTQLKRYLKERHVPFKEYDVSRDMRRADEMIKKSGQMGVPVLDINGKVITGFDKEKIDRALR